MLVLITYDVSIENENGTNRLRHVAKVCQKYGQRVQNSVFECLLDAAQYVTVKSELADIIDDSVDSIRFYRLGNNYKNQVEHLGAKQHIPQDSILLL